MGKKRQRERHQNPQPFLAEDNDSVASKKRTKSKEARKQHQIEERLISSGISSKILKQAQIQQKEIEEEETRAQNPNNSLLDVTEEPHKDEADRELEDIDDFDGFTETQSRFGDYEEINEEDEKLLEAFLSKNVGSQRTLADVIVAKIKQQDSNVTSDVRPLPALNTSTIGLYKEIGTFLSKYTAGKIPKAFKLIPKTEQWEYFLHLTEPENWSPNAMYQATRIFTSGVKTRVERFNKLVLLPRVRKDIRKNQRLHFALYQSLKKSLYRPAAFFKGILFPLCKSGTCNLREAVILGSIIQKVSIPSDHSSVALMTLADMEYCGTTSYFIKLLLEKSYALPYRVLDATVAHFMRFLKETRIMPVIWHQSLLAFVQRYKHELQKEDKDNLRELLKSQEHYLVTPEIRRELNNSRNRGEKEADPMSIVSPFGVINKPFEEDMFDIPEVPMEDD